jgi:hypothetical protein
MVNGTRNEMSKGLWKIEIIRDLSLEALKHMIRNGLESTIGAGEKIMNRMAKEKKESGSKGTGRTKQNKWNTGWEGR